MPRCNTRIGRRGAVASHNRRRYEVDGENRRHVTVADRNRKIGVKIKTKSRLRKNINYLPVEVLVEIFYYLPRNNLINIGVQCRKFRDAVGLLVKDDYIKFRKKIDSSIEYLSTRCTNLTVCNNLAFLRIMRHHLRVLDALLGKYTETRDTWNILAKFLIKVLEEQYKIFNSLDTNFCIITGCRASDLETVTPKLYRFYNIYLSVLESILQKLKKNVPFCVQMFNLLSSCPSANVKISVFSPLGQEKSYVNMFFELRRGSEHMKKENFNEFNLNIFEDDTIDNDFKLFYIKTYLFSLINGENFEFLRTFLLQIENSLRCTKRSACCRANTEEKMINYFTSACQTFSTDIYNEIEVEKTKFYYDDDKNEEVFKTEITSSQDTRMCKRNFIIELILSCDSYLLPYKVYFDNKDVSLTNFQDNFSTGHKEYIHHESKSDLIRYALLKKSLTKCNRNCCLTNDASLRMNLLVTSPSSKSGSLKTVTKKLMVKIFGEKMYFKVSKKRHYRPLFR